MKVITPPSAVISAAKLKTFLRGLILRLKEKLTGRKQEEDFDSEFPPPLE